MDLLNFFWPQLILLPESDSLYFSTDFLKGLFILTLQFQS